MIVTLEESTPSRTLYTDADTMLRSTLLACASDARYMSFVRPVIQSHRLAAVDRQDLRDDHG